MLVAKLDLHHVRLDLHVCILAYFLHSKFAISALFDFINETNQSLVHIAGKIIVRMFLVRKERM